MDWEVQQPILQRHLANSDFLEFGIAGMDGIVHYSDGSTAGLWDRNYIQKALAGESNVSDLIVSRVTGDVVLMYAAPIVRDGETVGVLIAVSYTHLLFQIVIPLIILLVSYIKAGRRSQLPTQ